MSSFVLRHTHASGLLLPARFSQVLPKALAPLDAGMKGQELRLARALDLDDDACAGFILDFPAQGQRVEASARGPSAALLAWALHALARTLKFDIESELDNTADETVALAYLDAYEADVNVTRSSPPDEGASAAFVAWLAREKQLALAESQVARGDFEEWPLDDAPRLYELLIESDAIDEVFLSERELTRLLARFKARASWLKGR